MPTARKVHRQVNRRYLGKRWKPEYLLSALRVFTPIDPCSTFPKGKFHLVNREDITAEEVVCREGGQE